MTTNVRKKNDLLRRCKNKFLVCKKYVPHYGYIPNEAVSDNPTPSYASGTDEEDCSSSGIFQ